MSFIGTHGALTTPHVTKRVSIPGCCFIHASVRNILARIQFQLVEAPLKGRYHEQKLLVLQKCTTKTTKMPWDVLADLSRCGLLILYNFITHVDVESPWCTGFLINLKRDGMHNSVQSPSDLRANETTMCTEEVNRRSHPPISSRLPSLFQAPIHRRIKIYLSALAEAPKKKDTEEWGDFLTQGNQCSVGKSDGGNTELKPRTPASPERHRLGPRAPTCRLEREVQVIVDCNRRL